MNDIPIERSTAEAASLSRSPGAEDAEIALVIASGAFDADYYNRQIPRPLAPLDGLRDYLAIGERAGRRPHALFDPVFVSARLPPSTAPDHGSALVRYLRAPALELAPHPLFDVCRFRKLSGTPPGVAAALVDHERLNRAGLTCPSPCALFDPAHYQQSDGNVRGLSHYLSVGWREGRSPHPLFQPRVWAASVARLGHRLPRDIEPLTAYFVDRATWPASPHTLFEPAVFARQLAEHGQEGSRDIPPLVDLLERHWRLSAHDLFDPDFYRAGALQAGIDLDEHPLLHHARHNGRAGIDPHPLFSVRHYLRNYQDVSRSSLDPLQHFIRHGRQEGRSPNALLSPKQYAVNVAERFGMASEDAVGHYAAVGGRALVDPHPLFEAALYAASHPACRDETDMPLAHYARHWQRRGYRFPPWGTALYEQRPARDGEGRFDLVVLSHEMTRTGAPLILLGLVRAFALRGLSCLVVTAAPGDLMEAFREWAPVVDLSLVRQAGMAVDDFVRLLVETLADDDGPIPVLANTACVSDLGAAFVAAGAALVTLVHELPTAFDESVFQTIYRCSRRVVFPAVFVRNAAHKAFALSHEKADVLPQGLLDPAFGRSDATAARRVALREAAAPNEAFVVLGCGTRDMRKGIDIFAAVATAAIARQAAAGGAARPLYFLWVGGGDAPRHSPSWYVERDLEAAGLVGRVRFIASRSRTEPYFLGCDAFVLTSRQDPFPCVVHEAMACGKPVIAFDGAGGAPEALAGGAGVIVGYGDVEAMATAIVACAHDPAAANAMGSRGAAIVRQRYDFAAYADRVLETLAIDGRDAPTAATSVDPAPRRAVLALPTDLQDQACEEIVELSAALADEGIEAELLFCGDRPPSAAVPALARMRPERSVRVLTPTFRRRLSHTDRWRRVLGVLEAAGPAIFAPGTDPIADAVVPIVPRRVGVLGLLRDSTETSMERVLRLGRYWQRVVVPASSLRDLADDLVPGLGERCVVIPPGIDGHGVDRLEPVTGQLRVFCGLDGLSSSAALRLADDIASCLGGSGAALTLYGIDPAETRLASTTVAAVAANEVTLLAAAPGATLTQVLDGHHVFVAPGPPPVPRVGVPLGALGLGLLPIRLGFGEADDWPVGDETGFALPPGDWAGLRRAVDALIADPARCDDRRRRSRAAAWSRSVDRSTHWALHAALIREMQDELRDGSYSAPFAPAPNPELGGLSLAPSLIAHPDRVVVS